MKLKSIDTQATEKARSAVDTLVACNLLKAADLKEAEAILRELFRRELNVLHLHEYPELFHPTLIALGITTVDDLRTLALSDFASVANKASKKLDNFVSLIKARHNITIPSVASKLSTEFASKRSINTIPALMKMNFAGFQSSPKPIRNRQTYEKHQKILRLSLSC